jgi:hypothetical protein
MCKRRPNGPDYLLGETPALDMPILRREFAANYPHLRRKRPRDRAQTRC